MLIVAPIPKKIALLIKKLPRDEITKMKVANLPSYQVTKLANYRVIKFPRYKKEEEKKE